MRRIVGALTGCLIAVGLAGVDDVAAAGSDAARPPSAKAGGLKPGAKGAPPAAAGPSVLSPKLLPKAPDVEMGLRGATLSPVPEGSDPTADEAYAAFQRGLYLQAMVLAIGRAEDGDRAAMCLIGVLYEGGLGVRVDLAKAAKWYGLAADRGDREAEAALAQMYADGRGVARDPKKAWSLYAAAAEKGQPTALFNGAMMMFDGRDAPHDPDKAREWLGRAAELGAIEAQYAYALVLGDPEGPRPDPRGAARWMREAALAGFEAAEIDFALMLANGRGVRKSEEDAFVWFRRSALRGNAIGRNRLARMYAVGIGTAPDPVEAWKWHTLASRQGLPDLWLETRLSGLSAADRKRAEEEAELIADGELPALKRPATTAADAIEASGEAPGATPAADAAKK